MLELPISHLSHFGRWKYTYLNILQFILLYHVSDKLVWNNPYLQIITQNVIGLNWQGLL